MRILTTLATVTALVVATTGCKPESSSESTRQADLTTAARTEPQLEANPEPSPSAAAGASTIGEAPQQERPHIVDDRGNRIPVTVGTAAGYVPDSACRSCHTELYDSYQHVGMARSAYKPTTDNIIEDYENNNFYHELSDRYYEMTHSDGVFLQKRYRLDSDGQRINEIMARVDLVIGSGNHMRTYVTRNAAGELFQLPVSWYTQTGRWGMTPGYDLDDHPGLTRQVDRECMFCHNAYPEQPVGTDLVGEPHAFPPNLPEGIGCQRCHSPGAEHTRLAYADPTAADAIRQSIVNPANLPPGLRDDVCLQCHLQPSANATSFMRINGRSDYSYKPGEPIQDYMLVVDYQTENVRAERFEINHHAYRLTRSPCFIASGGAMSCLTCHDPHRKPKPDERIAYYRDRCLSCHKVGACRQAAISTEQSVQHTSTGPDCTGCHMPKHRTEDVIQVVMTDHLIRRDPAPDEWLAPRKERRKHPFRAPQPYPMGRDLDADSLSLHLGMLGAPLHTTVRLDRFRAAMDEVNPEGADVHLYRAQLEQLAGNHTEAEKFFRKVIEQNPKRLGGYNGLAFALVRQGRHDAAVDIARRAVAINPTSSDAYYLLGTALLAMKRVNEAGPMFQRAVQLRPYHTNAHANLGAAFASIGNFESAISEHQAVLAINPLDVAAYVDLAPILVYLKRSEEALAMLQDGILLRPKASPLYESLAMVLATMNDLDGAAQTCTKARELGADDTICAMIDALVYHDRGDAAKAIKAFQIAQDQAKSQKRGNVLYRMVLDQARAAFDP